VPAGQRDDHDDGAKVDRARPARWAARLVAPQVPIRPEGWRPPP